MIDESEKCPLAVLTVIIVSLFAYNILTIRDHLNETGRERIAFADLDTMAKNLSPSSLKNASLKTETSPLRIWTARFSEKISPEN